MPNADTETADVAATCSEAVASCPKLEPLLDYLHGLTDRGELGRLAELLGDLDVTGKDLSAWCSFGSKAYKRNTIARGEMFELLALCWRSRQATPIHDHRGSSCAFRVIEGTGVEIRYEKTDCGLVVPTESVTMQPGYVCAAEDEDIHQVVNAQCEESNLITMHLYTPALHHINTYDAPGARIAKSVEGSDDLYA